MKKESDLIDSFFIAFAFSLCEIQDISLNIIRNVWCSHVLASSGSDSTNQPLDYSCKTAM